MGLCISSHHPIRDGSFSDHYCTRHHPMVIANFCFCFCLCLATCVWLYPRFLKYPSSLGFLAFQALWGMRSFSWHRAQVKSSLSSPHLVCSTPSPPSPCLPQNLFYFLFSGRYTNPPWSPLLYFTSLILWIVAWLSFT